uniref:Sulfotransferase domain-containing protein n=1 Tax=Plectus sambesii TaxID=2011161 RepID=A0A914WAE2_9BILA
MAPITRTLSSDSRSDNRLNKENFDEALIRQPPGHPKHKCFFNHIWSPIFTPELIRSAKSYEPEKGDVFIATYPKCGTTWTQHICSQLMIEDYEPTDGKELFITSPMIDEKGAEFVKQLPSPRLLKTHFEWTDVPKSKDAKYIFVCRNPKDS